jgi:hypothetical protein
MKILISVLLLVALGWVGGAFVASGSYVGGGLGQFILTNLADSTVAASTTVFAAPFSPAATTSELNKSYFCLASGTMMQLYVRTSGAQPATGSLVVTVRKNQVDTAVTLTVAASDPAGTFNSGTLSATCTVPDQLTVGLTNNATGASATIAEVGFMIQ